jgi:hypothetical protein
MWDKPHIYTNSDATLDSRKGCMGFGFVVLDNMGHILAAKSVMKRGFFGTYYNRDDGCFHRSEIQF